MFYGMPFCIGQRHHSNLKFKRIEGKYDVRLWGCFVMLAYVRIMAYPGNGIWIEFVLIILKRRRGVAGGEKKKKKILNNLCHHVEFTLKLHAFKIGGVSFGFWYRITFHTFHE